MIIVFRCLQTILVRKVPAHKGHKVVEELWLSKETRLVRWWGGDVDVLSLVEVNLGVLARVLVDIQLELVEEL